MRVAAIGDIHGCIEELEELYAALQWHSLDEIWSLGDIVDRGPDSGACVSFLQEHGIKAVRGNHDDVIVNWFERTAIKGGPPPSNADKCRTVFQLNHKNYEYLKSLPPLHVIDKINLVLVHGGIWPNLPLYKQPRNVIRAQMIKPNDAGRIRWWGEDAPKQRCGKTEEECREDGYERWYRIYDHKQDIAFGHSVYVQPYVYQRDKKYGTVYGLDTGVCYGGSLTAGIFDGSKKVPFISVKSKKDYAQCGFIIGGER